MAYPSPELRAYSCNCSNRLLPLRGFLLIGFAVVLVCLAPQVARADGEEEEKPSFEGYVIDDPLYNIERKVDTIDEKVDALTATDQLDGIEGLMTAETPEPKSPAAFFVSKSDINRRMAKPVSHRMARILVMVTGWGAAGRLKPLWPI